MLPPAALTSMSIRPQLLHDGIARGLKLPAVEHVGGQRQRGAALRFDRPHGVLGLLAAAAQHADLRAGPRQPARHRAAQHARAAGDDRDLPFQAEEVCQ